MFCCHDTRVCLSVRPVVLPDVVVVSLPSMTSSGTLDLGLTKFIIFMEQ